MRLLLVITYFLLFSSCGYNKDDIIGLWQLERIEKDGFVKEGSSTFIEIKEGNVFAVSKTSGDIIGVYSLKGNRLELHSRDQTWFNTNWELSSASHILEWHGLEIGYGNVFLKFRKIEVIPDFAEFEKSVLGKWELYKIRKDHQVKKLTNIRFVLGEDGKYAIIEGEQVLEHGKAIINPRHQKIIFESERITWNAWFYGEELRLNNEKVGIEYSLRRFQDGVTN